MELEKVEKKVLSALILLADKNNRVDATQAEIAKIMGYKKSGGTITYALRSLEQNKAVKKLGKGRYQILI